MSYDLTFIKYNKKPRMEANKMYEILMAREIVAGLDHFGLLRKNITY